MHGKEFEPRLTEVTVLVVDDQETNLAFLDRMLRVAGVRDIVAIADPRDAVARCLEVKPDLVLLDLHMPHLDGIQVLEGLQAAWPSEALIPVIVLTADSSPEARDRALRAGATDFLSKPFDRTEVLQRISSVLG